MLKGEVPRTRTRIRTRLKVKQARSCDHLPLSACPGGETRLSSPLTRHYVSSRLNLTSFLPYTRALCIYKLVFVLQIHFREDYIKIELSSEYINANSVLTEFPQLRVALSYQSSKSVISRWYHPPQKLRIPQQGYMMTATCSLGMNSIWNRRDPHLPRSRHLIEQSISTFPKEAKLTKVRLVATMSRSARRISTTFPRTNSMFPKHWNRAASFMFI